MYIMMDVGGTMAYELDRKTLLLLLSKKSSRVNTNMLWSRGYAKLLYAHSRDEE